MNILFIYNNISELSAIEQHLRTLNHRIYVAMGLNDAIPTLSRIKIDLIFCDLLSDRIDGIKIMRTLKSSENFYSIPFVLISSSLFSEEDISFFRKIGALSVIEKPIKFRSIQNILDSLLKNPELGFEVRQGLITDDEFIEEYSNILTRKIQKRVREMEADQIYILNMINSIPSAIFLINRDFKIYDLNDTALRFLGAGSKEEIKGKNCYSIIYKGNSICNLPGHRCPILGVIQEKQTTEHFTSIEIGETKRHLNIHFAPILNPHNNSVMMLENITDNTYLVDLIEKNKEKEFRLEAILKESKYGIMLIEGDQIIDINSRAMELLGLSDKNLLRAIEAIGREEYEEMVRTVEQNVIFYKNIALHLSQEIRHILLEAEKILYQERTFYLVVMYDNTEYLRLVRRIQERERLSSIILENIGDIFILVYDNKIVEASKQIENFYNGSRTTMIKQNLFSALPFIKEEFLVDDRPKETIAKDNQNRERTLILRCYRLMIDERRHTLIQITDITEQREWERRKRAENERMQYIDRLEMIYKLTGGIAHNFNNILEGIYSYAEYLQKEKTSFEDSLMAINIIKKLTKNAAKLTSRIFNLSRIEQKNYKSIDIQTVIDEVVDIASTSFAKNIEIKTERNSDANIINGDFNSIFQSLLNIIINAKEAMPDGGTITISTSNKNSTDLSCRLVEIRISDTGCGIDEKIGSNIFAPYLSSKDLPGSGLGLSMAYNTIINHGGSIEYESIKGKGTTFKITFPVIEEGLPPQQYTENKVYGNNKKILIISENGLEREIIRRILIKNGYDAYTVIDSQDGLQSLSITQPAVIIMDSNLTRLSPLNTFKEIKKTYNQIPIILYTGLIFDDIVLDLIKCGLIHIIYKPLDTDELLLAIRNILSEKPAGQITPQIETERQEKAPMKILIVDDEEFILSALKMNLSDRYDIHIEASVTKALERLLNNERFDRYILDINTPDINGLEFYSMIKELDPDIDQKVIFITGGITDDRMIEELKRLRDGISLLKKPFEIDDLIKILS